MECDRKLTHRIASILALAGAAGAAMAQSEDGVVRPPPLEPPGASGGLLVLGVIVLGLALVVAPAVIPSKRAHNE